LSIRNWPTGPREYTSLWQIAQRLTDSPVKFGAICAPALASMLWNEHYKGDKDMMTDLCDVMKCVPLVEGTNIVRRELGLPEAHIRAADPKLYFASVDES
jgi:hypothetical protein